MGATGQGGGKGNNSINSFNDGPTTIKLDSPLVYSDNIQYMGNGKNQIITFENKQIGAKREHNLLIMNDGSVVESNTGGKKKVSASISARLKADIYTHNHPREEGVLGGSFSAEDMSNFIQFNQRMYRAAAKEGTYVISKGNNYDATKGAEFVKQITDFQNQSYKSTRKYTKQLQQEYDAAANKISADNSLTFAQKQAANNKAYKEVSDKLARYANNELLALHNWYITNANKYGLVYSLERRK